MPTVAERPAAQLRGTGRTPRSSARLSRRAEPYGYIAPTVILIGLLLVIPISVVVWYSLFDNAVTDKSPEFVGIDNYAELLSDGGFYKALVNTLVFTVTSVAAHLVLGLAFALLLNSQLIGRVSLAIYRAIYVLPWLFTVAIIAVLWRLILSPNGIVNYLLSFFGGEQIEWLASPTLALGAVTFINIWAGYPFFMVSLLAGLQGVPADLYEAARVDGAGAWRRFTAVTLPQIRPVIISMSLLDLIWTSQQFALIWMTTGGGPVDATELVSTFTYKLAFTRYEFGLASASAVIVLLLSMILAVLYVRHLRREGK
ncbi:carbohydrate ABC transporter permease [Microbacterium karelineae]|uniref:carbohydrate ABC transporter permease n=1 Tax=Microbacterium karelineae TaxID=2654283 RepID=UPI0012EA9FCE|nr:sugar ABC transporter permease [Microbacterium karelineae]